MTIFRVYGYTCGLHLEFMVDVNLIGIIKLRLVQLGEISLG